MYSKWETVFYLHEKNVARSLYWTSRLHTHDFVYVAFTISYQEISVSDIIVQTEPNQVHSSVQVYTHSLAVCCVST